MNAGNQNVAMGVVTAWFLTALLLASGRNWFEDSLSLG
jgi:hypothetical protein